MTLERLLADARNVGRQNGNGRTSSLEQRVAQLEQAVSALAQQPPAADQISPNYITVTPAGIGAAFTGFINALGLILPAASSFAPGPANQIQWTEQPGGAVLAEITDLLASNRSEIVVESFPTGTSTSEVLISTANSDINISSNPNSVAGASPGEQVELQAGQFPDFAVLQCVFNLAGNAFVQASAFGARGEHNITIVDDADNSSFLQISDGGSPQRARLTWGVATTGTGAIVHPGSGDWSVGSASTGVCAINFPARNLAPCILLGSYNSGTQINAQVLSVGTSSFTLYTYNTSSLALTNSTGAFAIIG